MLLYGILCFFFGLVLATTDDCPRVRRELRTLTDDEWTKVHEAMWIMKTKTTVELQAEYGERCMSYDDQLVNHAVGYNDPDGDQGHNGPAFMTFHRMVVLRFETCLLLIDPSIGAMPYWDSSLDAKVGGVYSGTADSVYSNKWFGPYVGNPAEDYQVTTGPFAYWPINSWTEYHDQEFAEVSYIWSGSNFTGKLRDTLNTLETDYLTRFPKTVFATTNWVGGADLTYSQKDAEICNDEYYINQWIDLQRCIEFELLEVGLSFVVDPSFPSDRIKVNNAHSQPHVKTGSAIAYFDGTGTLTPMSLADSLQLTERAQFDYENGVVPSANIAKFIAASGEGNQRMGDMYDVATSVNDPLFMFHHAGMDKYFMNWQYKAYETDPSMESDEVLWKYPSREEGFGFGLADASLYGISGPYLNATTNAYEYTDGHYLNDIISKRRPFRGLINSDDASTPTDGYTHKDAMKYFKPTNSPYIYDSDLYYKQSATCAYDSSNYMSFESTAHITNTAGPSQRSSSTTETIANAFCDAIKELLPNNTKTFAKAQNKSVNLYQMKCTVKEPVFLGASFCLDMEALNATFSNLLADADMSLTRSVPIVVQGGPPLPPSSDCYGQCGQGSQCVETTLEADPSDPLAYNVAYACVPDASECCQASDSCKTADIAANCVCGFDPYCCNTAWDSQCIKEAEDRCGLVC